MRTFKNYLDEKGRCWPGHRPVPGKKPYSPGSCVKEDYVKELEDGLKKLENHDYDTIDELMQKIAKKHDITGKDLHNEFKSKHGKKPDDWIKEEVELDEDLRQWFKQKWVRMDTKGNIKGQCAREPGEGKPKCLPQAKAHSLGKEKRAAAAQRKRREDPNPERRGKAINVKTEELDLDNITQEDINEAMMVEKNKPTQPEKWARAKAAAKSKFAVYPSAYANAWAAKKYKSMGGGWRSTKEEVEFEEELYENYDVEELFDILEEVVDDMAYERRLDPDHIWENLNDVTDEELFETAAWRRKEGKSPTGGLNAKGIASYRRENPGSKLKKAVTGKVKPGSKAAKRRKSFCARMGGMKGPMKKPNGEPTRKALALRKWKCR